MTKHDEAADQRAPSPAVDRALTILETLVMAESPMTLTALAHTAEVPVATCASIVQTLELRGYAARRIVGRSHLWRATLKLNALSAELVRKVDLGAIAQPHLRALMESTGMAAHLGALEGRMVVYVAKASPPGMVQFDTYPGKTAPFHLTALGRAIAAHLPDDQVSQLLSGAQPGGGPNARPVNVRRLRETLRQVRERGYALEDEEEDENIGCVAAPYFDAYGNVSGSIGVTGFADRVRGKSLREVSTAVVRQSKSLTREFAGVIGGAADR